MRCTPGPCALKTNSKSSKCTWWGLAKPKQVTNNILANRQSLPSCLDISISANGCCHIQSALHRVCNNCMSNTGCCYCSTQQASGHYLQEAHPAVPCQIGCCCGLATRASRMPGGGLFNSLPGFQPRHHISCPRFPRRNGPGWKEDKPTQDSYQAATSGAAPQASCVSLACHSLPRRIAQMRRYTSDWVSIIVLVGAPRAPS
jgi:hypothetical protein